MANNASRPLPVRASPTAVPFPASTTAMASSPLSSTSSQSTASTWTSFSATTSHGSRSPNEHGIATANATTPLTNPAASARPSGTTQVDSSVSTGPHHKRWGIPTKLNTPPLTPVCADTWSASATNSTTSRPNIHRARSPSAPTPFIHAIDPRSRYTADALVFPLDDLAHAGHDHAKGKSGFGTSSANAMHGLSWPIEPQHYEARPYPEHFDQTPFSQTACHPSERHPSEYHLSIYSTSSPRSSALSRPTLPHHHSQPNLNLHVPPSNGRPLSYVNESDEGSGSGSGSDGGDSGRRLARRSLSTLGQSVSGKNVYIHSVRPYATKEMLEQHASLFGEVYSCRIQGVGNEPLSLVANGTAYLQGLQRRCAFVLYAIMPGGVLTLTSSYKKPEEAAAFIEYLRGLGDDFQTEWKVREDRDSSNLYIQGLPLITTPEDLQDLFRVYGKVLSCKFLESSDGRSRRGPALARLESRAQADAAIKGLNGMPYKGDEQHVLVVRIADSNEQKEYKQRTQRMLNGLASSSTPSLGRDGSHRLSTSDFLAIAAKRERIREEREQLQLAIARLEAEEEHLAARSAPRSHSLGQLYQLHATAFNDCDPYITPPRSATSHHRPSTSTMRSDRTWSSSTYGGNIWTPTGHITSASASHNDTDSVRRVRFDANLHHARSTPDLGKAEEGVKLLWKDTDRGQ